MKLPRRFVLSAFAFACAAAAPAFAAELLAPAPAGAAQPTQVPAAQRPAIGSKVWIWESLQFNPNATGGRREVTNNPTPTMRVFESHITTLNPSLTTHDPHQHGQEEFIIVKEGLVQTHINGRTERVGPGSLFFFASNDWHNATNAGDKPSTYLVFNVQTALSSQTPTDGVEKLTAAKKMIGKLQSAVYDWQKMTVTKTATGERRNLFNSPTATMANLEAFVETLNPGQTPHAAHQHADEELIVVTDGTLEVTLDGATHRGTPGSIFFYASGSKHSMKNSTTAPVTYYAFRIATEKTPTAGAAPAKSE